MMKNKRGKKGDRIMKALRTVLWTVIITLGTAGPALAQTGRQDNSGIFIWAFLGLCALIVAAQAIPAILMMIGTARAVAKGIKEGEQKPAEVKAESE
jgi:hypothetical protein